MNYLLKSKPKRNFDFKYLTVLGVFVLLFGLSFFFPGFFRTVSHQALKPFWVLKEKTTYSFRYVVTYLKFQNFLTKENADLKEQLALLRLSQTEYEALQKENDELKNAVGENNLDRKIMANVLSKPPQSAFDTFVIDKGDQDGVVLGKTVYLSNDIILGEIVSVTGKTSVLKLFSGSGEVTEATNSRTGANFVLKGEGGSNFTVEVPKDADIIWGDNFTFPADGPILATVSFVDTSSQSSFKNIYLKVPGNILQIKRVFVEK